ncbi:MAG: hypothetical protein NTZ46_07155 [Verrucomicrobia bacterium]|nr:hypothetical protein [Verrucomicrobiota bacterium]
MDPIVLVIAGAFALGKWLLQNAGKSAPEEPRTPSSRPLNPGSGDPSGTESEEERMRRFMEALGLPPNSVPPPVRKPAPRVEKPAFKPLPKPKPNVRQPGPPLASEKRPVASSTPEQRRDIAPPLETGGPLPSIPKAASVEESAPSMEVTSIPQITFGEPEQAVAGAAVSDQAKPYSRATLQKQPESGAQAALREQLREPDSLRKAILLREILGPPKGLQSAQSPSIFSPL